MKLSDGFYQDIGSHLPENITGADLQAVCSNAWLIAVRRTITSLKNGTPKNLSLYNEHGSIDPLLPLKMYCKFIQ